MKILENDVQLRGRQKFIEDKNKLHFYLEFNEVFRFSLFVPVNYVRDTENNLIT